MRVVTASRLVDRLYDAASLMHHHASRAPNLSNTMDVMMDDVSVIDNQHHMESADGSV